MKKLSIFLLIFSVLSFPSRMANAIAPNTLPVITCAVTTASAVCIAANIARRGIWCQNTGAVTVILKVGSASAASEGILLPVSTGYWEPYIAPNGAIYLESTSSTSTVYCQEWQ